MKTFVNVIFPATCITALIASMGVALGGFFPAFSQSQPAPQTITHASVALSAICEPPCAPKDVTAVRG